MRLVKTNAAENNQSDFELYVQTIFALLRVKGKQIFWYIGLIMYALKLDS